MIRSSLITAVSALALAACGGGEEEPATETAGTEGDTASHSRVEAGYGPESPERAETDGEQAAAGEDAAGPAMSEEAQTILADFGAPYTNANLENGQRIFRRCATCHTLNEGGRNLVGPNLYGVFGRKVGSVEGFRYSDALQEADFRWTPQRLDEWLANPREFLPGNRMAFPGLREAEDRTDVIAYVAVETHAEPGPTPPQEPQD